MLKIVLAVLVLTGVQVKASSECAWFIGKLVCSKEANLAGTVVEIWDLDRPKKFFRMNMFDKDDLAGKTVLAVEDNGDFKVEGCASDVDWLGPIHENKPEFYLKVKHHCRGTREEMTLYPPDMRVYAPDTMDYYFNNPIVLG